MSEDYMHIIYDKKQDRFWSGWFTVSVRSGAFRHNQDSAGTHGLYWHNKTSLLAQSAKMTPTENVPGIKQPKKDTYRVKRK